MTSNQPRGAGGRLWWVIRTTLIIFIVVILVGGILAGLGYAGYWGVQEIQRSNNSLSVRIDANEQNLNSLRDLVNSEFAQGNPEQQVQIDQLENELALLTQRLETLQAAQLEDTAVQTEQFNALETELATAVAQNGDLTDELATVQEALVALQGDLNNNGGRIDELGGDLDHLRLQLGSLDETVTELTDMTAAHDSETAHLQQAFSLLRLWGVLTYARLTLADGDLAGAETAVAQAVTLSNTLTAEADSPTAEALARLQTRLDLAAAGFDTDLPTVAQDLEAAGRELNLLLSGPTQEGEAVETTATPTEASGDATTTPTATPEPGETPQPSPTPTP